MTDVLFVNNDDVRGLAEPSEYVEAVRDAYRQRGNGAAAEPRTKLTTPDRPDAKFTSYLSILPETGVMGGYVYAARFGPLGTNHLAALFDFETGALLALVEGTYMNPFKTGAAGATGVDALARPDARTVGIVGSGTQALGQLASIATVRDIDEVRVYSPTRGNREAFATKVTEDLQLDATAVDTSGRAVDGADIVVTATKASEPVFDGDRLEPGTHVNAVGQYWPHKREVDSTVVSRAKYVPDLRDRAFQDAGAFLLALEEGAISEDHVYAELGDVVAGTVPGRESAEEITMFDSGGTAIETAAGAYLLYEKAREEGLGTWLEFSSTSDVFDGLDFL
ncbi:MAG: ornithine cyclodeaminase family protein [Halobacteriota archaeon]